MKFFSICLFINKFIAICKVKSFNEVKNLCFDGAMNEKKNIMDKNFYQKTLKEYPIILNSDFFNKP